MRNDVKTAAADASKPPSTLTSVALRAHLHESTPLSIFCQHLLEGAVSVRHKIQTEMFFVDSGGMSGPPTSGDLDSSLPAASFPRASRGGSSSSRLFSDDLCKPRSPCSLVGGRAHDQRFRQRRPVPQVEDAGSRGPRQRAAEGVAQCGRRSSSGVLVEGLAALLDLALRHTNGSAASHCARPSWRAAPFFVPRAHLWVSRPLPSVQSVPRAGSRLERSEDRSEPLDPWAPARMLRTTSPHDSRPRRPVEKQGFARKPQVLSALLSACSRSPIDNRARRR